MKNNNFIGKFIAECILLLVGIVFIIVSSVITGSSSKLKDRCNFEETAKVIGFKESQSDGSVLYTPVFQYNYQGKNYESSMNSYSNNMKDKFWMNSEYKIRVNTDNPQEIYVEEIASETDAIAVILKRIGIIVAAIAVVLFAISAIRFMIILGLFGVAVVGSNKFNQEHTTADIIEFKPRNGLDGLGNIDKKD